MKKNKFFGMSLFFLFGGIFMIVIGVFYAYDNNYYTLDQDGVRVQGKIIKYIEAPNDESSDFIWLYNSFNYILSASGISDEIFLKSYFVSAEFTAENGKSYKINNKFVIELDLKANEWRKVEIVYYRDKPDEAVIYDFFYFYGISILLIGIGAINLLIAFAGYKL